MARRFSIIKIKLNEREIEIEDSLRVFEVAALYKPGADIAIIDGYPASMEEFLTEGCRLSLIKRGEKPDREELSRLMAARHTPEVHEKLRRARVAIAGLGGLGSHAALSLARMGIGELKLVDYDVVEPSNLNRQCYNASQIGMKKTEALKKNIMDANPFVSPETADLYVTKENAEAAFAGYDVIIEAFDKGETKAMFIPLIAGLFPDSFIVGASGVAGLGDTRLLQIKQISSNCVIVGDFETEARPGMGLMATRVATAANIQANVAVRHILGENY